MPTTPHEVTQGECLEIIAHRAGLPWKYVWDHSSNAALKSLRKNPNVLFPGDVVNIPDTSPKPFFLETGKTHTFELPRTENTRIDVVLAHAGKPRAKEDCIVKVPGLDDTPATTKEDGRLEFDLPAEAEHATVCMKSDGLSFEFDLGHIDPILTISGVQGRLLALGYGCGEDNGVLGMATRQAICRFRKDNALSPGAELNDEVRAKLEEVFGA
ncbi:MAG TPA: peptidoglycan-binding domain-containing protein [Polyangia bacterium]